MRERNLRFTISSRIVSTLAPRTSTNRVRCSHLTNVEVWPELTVGVRWLHHRTMMPLLHRTVILMKSAALRITYGLPYTKSKRNCIRLRSNTKTSILMNAQLSNCLSYSRPKLSRHVHSLDLFTAALIATTPTGSGRKASRLIASSTGIFRYLEE